MLDDHDFAIYWLRQVKFSLKLRPDPRTHEFDSKLNAFVPSQTGSAPSTSRLLTSAIIENALKPTRLNIVTDPFTGLPTLTDVHAHGITVSVKLTDWYAISGKRLSFLRFLLMVSANDNNPNPRFSDGCVVWLFGTLCWSNSTISDVANVNELNEKLKRSEQHLFAPYPMPVTVDVFLPEYLFNCLPTDLRDVILSNSIPGAVRSVSVSAEAPATAAGGAVAAAVPRKDRSKSNALQTSSDSVGVYCTIKRPSMINAAAVDQVANALSFDVSTVDGTIQVVPILISQGVNEMQTMANLAGDDAAQFNINMTSFAILKVCSSRVISFFIFIFYFYI